MDPKVCGKLLTHHRRSYGVDVGALRDRFPLRRSAGKGPEMVSHGYRRLRRWKKVFRGSPGCFQGIRVYIGERSRSVELRGAHEGGVALGPPRRTALPRGHLAASLTSTPSLLDCVCSKKDPREGFIPFGFRLIFLFCETLK